MKMNRIIKPKKFDRFTVVPSAIFRAEGISAGATGLYCWLFSHDSNQMITKEFICGHFKEGKDALNTKLKELVNCGFLKLQEVRNKGKFAGFNFIVSDGPKKNHCGKTVAEKPLTVLTVAENPQQSNNIYNIYKDIESNNNINNNIQSPEIEISAVALKSFDFFANLFPENLRPKTKAQKNKWLETLDKLERIDQKDLREVYNICKIARADEFWKNNFLSILKLRNKNKDGVKYIDVFQQRFSGPTKPSGMNKIQNAFKWFLYKEPSGKQALGCKTKEGELFEYMLRQKLSENEIEEIKNYLNGEN